MTSEKHKLIRPDELALVKGRVFHLDLDRRSWRRTWCWSAPPTDKGDFLWQIWR